MGERVGRRVGALDDMTVRVGAYHHRPVERTLRVGRSPEPRHVDVGRQATFVRDLRFGLCLSRSGGRGVGEQRFLGCRTAFGRSVGASARRRLLFRLLGRELREALGRRRRSVGQRLLGGALFDSRSSRFDARGSLRRAFCTGGLRLARGRRRVGGRGGGGGRERQGVGENGRRGYVRIGGGVGHVGARQSVVTERQSQNEHHRHG